MSPDPLDKYLPPTKEREAIAAQQVEQFKREMYGHVLNKQRLAALPEAMVDETTEEAMAAADAAIDIIKAAIDSTVAE